MGNGAQQVQALGAHLAQMLSAHDSDCARVLGAALREGATPRPGEAAQTRPPKLMQALRAAPEDLASALSAAAPNLRWYEGGFGKAHDRGRVALWVARLFDRTGMVGKGDATAGLILIAPNYHYPEHSHAAEELYLVLSGELDWSVDGQDVGRKQPDAFVHHQPWQRHAMTTGDDPALLFWGWTGDTRAETYTLH
ncbi:dimethylsulfonioproprionate lyase family protein [Ruegeria sp. HKCCD8929]|uniref:dimethylsulfonioproprionate lyase family protein n=1 Tax=Ruegeria sp. HKCCD8929 TaxID=2683006 RepID=UPI00148903A1|nr:dimethylsulfonioproprionate lyase family protein [Ruegeria sp. HKCCD8929]